MNFSNYLTNKMKNSRICLKIKAHFIIVDQMDILYFFIKKDEIEVHISRTGKIILDISIEKIEELTDKNKFFRIHQNYLINIKAIDHFIKKDTKWYVIMSNQQELLIDLLSFESFKKRSIIL